MGMFRKVNAKERIVGFYSTGPQIRPNDLRIYELVKRFAPSGAVTPPVFVIIDVRPNRESIPTTAYRVVDEVDSTVPSRGGGQHRREEDVCARSFVDWGDGGGGSWGRAFVEGYQ